MGDMNFWVNYESFESYFTHPQWPLKYCSKERVHINLNNPDEQCNPAVIGDSSVVVAKMASALYWAAPSARSAVMIT